MKIWLLVGVSIAISVLSVIYWWRRPRSKAKEALRMDRPAEGGAPSEGEAADAGSRSLSATRWLRSLVKAGKDERTTRDGDS